VADFHYECRDFGGMATIMARNGVDARAIGGALGLDAPVGPARITGGDGMSLIGMGAGTWLARIEDAPGFWADELRERLSGRASVSDQSGAYVVFRLSGTDARTVLQRGVPIDLHPTQFGVGAAVATAIAYIAVIVWVVDGRPTFDVAVYRSFAASFQDWLDHAAAAL
jgi:heterotetrameric sarcosine oxidase gamma subunit